MSDFNLYSVNWQDGMLISRQHLKDQEAYFQELTRWYAGSIGDHYGLVRKSLSGQPALSLNMSIQGSHLRVEVLRCQAITPDGSFIEIQDASRNIIRAEMTQSGTAVVPVYITVDPAAHKQVGDPDPGEDIPRIPYLVRDYSLHLGERPNAPEGRCLQVAQLTIAGGEVMYADNYYPPCLTLYADERLVQRGTDFRNRLENLLSLSSRAYLAVSSPGALSGEKTELQTAFKDTIHQIVYHLAATIDEFVIGRNASHPMHLVIQFKRLFRVFSTLFNLYPGLKDYLNEKYFVKELNSDIGRFIASVDAFIMTEYNHNDLGGHLEAIDTILGTLRGILGFLAQVKKEQLASDAVATDTLTYHARTYRMVSYAASRLEQIGELSYLVIEIAEPRAISDTVILMAKDLYSVAEWGHMQVRLGLNQARGLGETDPVTVDATTFGNKVALRPQDMLKSPSVKQITLIFRGAREADKFSKLGKMDLIVYAI
ncbi:MAG TPA: hypothetical protein VMS71_06285 [Candidatus Acidoferrum sp.]|nr:hypothetical protein [Candidatus Acidoferrum sp.]